MTLLRFSRLRVRVFTSALITSGTVGVDTRMMKSAHATVLTLIGEGCIGQILLGGDVCMKTHLHAYGGKGYDHVPVRFLPLLRRHGVSEDDIHSMTVLNPARLLDVDRAEQAGLQQDMEGTSAGF